jgi:AcrR family transcriptional regulator
MVEPVNPSSRRGAQVAASEERIVRAAHRLFAERGYRATTLTDVADIAGVAHRTVYVRFGTKAALLKRVVDVALVGDFAPVDVAGRKPFQTAMTAPTLKKRINAWARGSARLMESAADVLAVAIEAESLEPSIADAGRAGRIATFEAVRTFWEAARSDGLLPAHCDVAWLVETTGVLAQADSYLRMRELMHLTPLQYERWVVVTWQRLAGI